MASPTVISCPLDCKLADQYREHVAVMGNMDGVHLGHQALIGIGKELSDKSGKPLGAIIFDPHPRQVFDPAGEPFLLTTKEQKAELLGQAGVQTVFALPFNRRLSMLSPEAFVEDILVGVLGLSGILVGAEFRFGQKRAGTTEDLVRLGEATGMVVQIVEPVALDGAAEKFSSSQARKALTDGDPQLAAQVLGRPWAIEGMVQKGQQLGRTIDFPTANISLGDYLHPAKGVYAVKVRIGDECLSGVANFGNRPTVDGKTLLLEVYLFEFDRDIYGETVEVEFHHFIRPEQKFDGLDALKAQITQDRDKAAMLLAQS